MYSKFFGFKEKPFILAPNPAYLFLGKSHEEAQAHLVYAVSEGEGFISLIGKRGVGKTTICQAFIDRRDDNIEVAYIFKPELRPAELLRKINSEFGIGADTDDAKDLIDTLNSFLMQKRVEGKKVVLFIDDAQNLKADSLEQVRLLSNLETTRDKLLQIVLVGEPSLADMLGSQALRQLGQRVSVSYYIDPLTYEETCAYIYHRMSIASLGAQTHFEASALKRIYKFSSGIPRMINIACDKSLFTAHRLKHSHISGEIAKTAIMDLAGRSGGRWFGFFNRRRTVLAGTGFCLLLLLMIAALFPRQADRQTVALQAEAKPAAVKQPAKPKANPPPDKTTKSAEKAHRANVPEVPEAKEPAVKAAVMPAASPAPEKVSPAPVKMTHSVQVGAFRNRKLSEKRVGTLEEKGYRAGILPVIDSKARTWYTVRIGDYPSREVARQHAEAFTSREKMESAVRPFEKL
ncbi:AAA family ATPase [Thermodesulfobacteriota bacterium]